MAFLALLSLDAGVSWIRFDCHPLSPSYRIRVTVGLSDWAMPVVEDRSVASNLLPPTSGHAK